MTSSNNDVLNKLNELLEYSIQNKPLHEVEYREKSQNYINSVNGYFQRDRSSYKKSLQEFQHSIYTYFSLKGTVFDPTQDLQISEGLTTDFSSLFYSFPIMSCDNSSFFNGWVYEWINIDEPTEEEKSRIYWRMVEVTESTDEETTTTSTTKYQYQKEIVVDNPLFNEWITHLANNGTDAIALANIDGVSNWICDACSVATDTMLWEEMGETVKQPEKKDIAYEVFVNRKLKDCTKNLNLPIRIPSYI